jgi:hypothetical protein
VLQIQFRQNTGSRLIGLKTAKTSAVPDITARMDPEMVPAEHGG